MQFYWLQDQVAQQQFTMYWHPGAKNMGDYYTKHFSPTHHIDVCTLHLKEANSTEARAHFQAPTTTENTTTDNPD